MHAPKPTAERTRDHCSACNTATNSGVQLMSATREDAFEGLKALRIKHGLHAGTLQHANEASIRLLLVDEILSLLNWDKQQFNPETKVPNNGGYTDYQLGERNMPRLIVEAKRLSHSFGTARQVLHKTEYDLAYLQSAFGPGCTEIVTQAKRYCEQTRVPYAILTNGGEWIIAQLIPPPGVTAADLKAFYVGNLLDENSSFELLWNIASRTSVELGSLEEAFDQLNRREYEFARSPHDSLGDLAAVGQRTSPPEDHSDFYAYFFDQMVDPQRANMLEHCYVTSARLDQYEGEIKRALEDSAPRFVEGAQELEPGDTQKIVLDRGGDMHGRVVLIVGAVGVGKTTFVTKIMRQKPERGHYFVLDLINELSVTEERVWQLAAQLLRDRHGNLIQHENLKRIFHRELEVVRRGPKAKVWEIHPDQLVVAEGDELERCVAAPDKLTIAIFKSLKSQRLPVAIFLDNVDRLDEVTQKSIYSIAHKISAQTGCMTIVPIRETTYFRAKEDGFLDVRTSDAVFHLQAPDLVQVLSRRIRYIEHQLLDDGELNDPRARAWRNRSDWEQVRTLWANYAAALKGALMTSKEGTVIVAMLGAVAWHSVRRFFGVLKAAHGSMLSHHLQWTLSNVVGALIVPQGPGGVQFISTTLFVSPAPKSLAHLLRLRILLYLRASPSVENRAWASFGGVARTLRTYGYRRSWIQSSLEGLVRERLVECLEIPAGADHARLYAIKEQHSFRLSALGLLLITEMVKQKPFLAAAGWSVSYLDQDAYTDYLEEANVVRSLVSEGPASVADLLANSRLPEIVAAYIYDVCADEVIQNQALAGHSDVAGIESELQRIVNSWLEIFPSLNEEVVVAESDHGTELSSTQTKFEWAQNAQEVRPTPKPKNLLEATLQDRSGIAAQILWVLVDAARHGITKLTGKQIAERINKLIRGEDRAVLATNVSRALRGRLLRSQPWLGVSHDRTHEKPRYSLQSGWEDAWRQTFASPVPDSP
jgi:AAA ATPase domain